MNIENKKQFATILLAVGLGLVAAFLTSQYVQNNVQQQTKQLAADYAKKNEAQKEAMLQEMALLQRDFNKKIAKLAKQQKQMSMASARRSSNKPIVPLSAFAVKTPPGKRAFTISIQSLSAVGGLINPGDFVDVIAKLRIPDGSGGENSFEDVTSVLFQNVQVLAVGTNFQPVSNKPLYEAQQRAIALHVTLAVTLNEAGLLSFAQENGSLQLSLRAPTEVDTDILQVASWETLADFVLEHQGTELFVPMKAAPKLKEMGGDYVTEVDEVKPFIQIFKSGRESNF